MYIVISCLTKLTQNIQKNNKPILAWTEFVGCCY